MLESASRIDWTKIQRILGEDSVLVGYRNADGHSCGMSMADLGELLSVDHFTPQGAFVPARPHLIEGMESNLSVIKEVVKRYFTELVTNGTKDIDSIGQVCLDSVKDYLDSGALRGIAPNAPATRKHKGHNLPDIENGELRNGLVFITIRGSNGLVFITIRGSSGSLDTSQRALPEST